MGSPKPFQDSPPPRFPGSGLSCGEGSRLGGGTADVAVVRPGGGGGEDLVEDWGEGGSGEARLSLTVRDDGSVGCRISSQGMQIFTPPLPPPPPLPYCCI